MASPDAFLSDIYDGRPEMEYRSDTSGHGQWFVMAAMPGRRPEGGAVVTHREITPRKQNEIALRESENRFRRLADALPIAIRMSERDQQCSYFNRQWLELTGRSEERELGVGWLENVHPEDRAACLETCTRAFEARKPFSMEYRIRRHDGEYRWVLDNGNPHYGDDGTFHGHVGGCIDITDRREAEQSLRDLSRKLIVAQEEERRRIARELHDHLSQRLALLAIELQQLGTNPPAGHDALVAAIQDLWHRTTEISSDVHSISHRLHPSRLEALGLVITIHGHCRDVSRRGVRVHFSERNVPSDVPPDVALCLFRILEEAVTNAIQHGGATDVSVTLARVDQELVLRIEDTGRGFDPAGKVPTLGLGLVSMRERLHSLGGTLTVASAPGHGALIEARVRCAMAAIGAPIEDSSPADIRIRAAGRDRLPRPLSFSADD